MLTSASAATSDPVLNDGSSNVALMAVKTKVELEEKPLQSHLAQNADIRTNSLWAEPLEHFRRNGDGAY